MPQFDATEDHVRLPIAAPASPSAAARPQAHTPHGHSTSVALALAHNFDLVVMPIGVALALALGGPAFGLLAGAGGWLLQRALAVVNRRLIKHAAAPGSRLGLDFIEAFGRMWLLAGTIVLAGAAGHRADGLAAALVIAISYSIAFAVRIARGRPQEGVQG